MANKKLINVLGSPFDLVRDDLADLTTRSHSSLQNLTTGDDHTQYVLRSILTTNGDLFTRAGGVISRLGIGTTNQILSVVGGAPSWTTGILDGSGNQLYVRRSGADTMTGFWNIGANKIGFNTAITSGNANVAVNGTTTSGNHYVLGSSATEVLWSATQGAASGSWYGWRWTQDETAGPCYLEPVDSGTARRAYTFFRTNSGSFSSYFKVGLVSWSRLTNETLGNEGFFNNRLGANFNGGGGSSNPQNLFKVWDSDGEGGTPMLYVDTNKTTGGFGVHLTNVANAFFNVAAGTAASNKSGFWYNCAATADNLLWWSSTGSGYSSTYGHGAIQDETTGHYQQILRNGGVQRGVFLVRRYSAGSVSGPYIGVGPDFLLGGTLPTARLHLSAGIASAGGAPLKFNSGTSLTTAEAGAVEFTTDDLFFTITTGAARKAFILDDGTRLTSGRVPFATTNGRLIDSSLFTFSASTGLTLSALNIITDTTTGMKIGTSTSQKLGVWNTAPIVQPTTAVAAATFVANTSNIVNDTATFDGYTIGQVVKALRNIGLLA